jgi:hypothetical protein
MTDHLSQLLSLLAKAERQQFGNYLRILTPDSREAELYELICKKSRMDTAALAATMYGDKEHTVKVRKVRKRLTDRLIDWLIATRQTSEKSRADRSPLTTISLCDALLERGIPELAVHYLTEAESRASGPDSAALLESILYYRLRYADKLGLDGPAEYKRWEANNKRYMTYVHLLGAETVLDGMLRQLRREGRVPDQEELMQQFYARFATVEEERRNPVFMYTLATIFRRVMLSSKDYWRIEPSIQAMYDELLHNNCFTEETRAEQVGFILMLAQAAYRNRRFELAEELLTTMRPLLPPNRPRNYLPYVKMISLRAAIQSYTSRYKEAIALLEKHLYGEDPVTHVEERCQMIFNLALSKYCNGEYDEALKVLDSIEQSSTWLFDRFGLEWIYKKEMVHVIILWEAKHYEAATKKLEAMCSKYATFLTQELYQRAAQFMQFVLRYFQNPEIITDVKFHLEIRDARMGWGEREDIHAILFFCWLRAKMLNRPFYPVMQARLKEDGKDWDYPFSLRG